MARSAKRVSNQELQEATCGDRLLVRDAPEGAPHHEAHEKLFRPARILSEIIFVTIALMMAAAAAHADPRSDCAGKKLPASVREAGCSAIIATTRDKALLERSYNRRGFARLELAHYADAVADFTETIRLNPRIAGYYDNRQNAYRLMGELDAALSDAYAAVKLAPTYAFVYRGRGNVFAEMAQWPRAIDDLSTAIRLEPDDSGLHVDRGKALEGAGRTQAAIDDYTQALALDHDDVEALKRRAFAARTLGRTVDAIADLETYRLVRPDDVEAAAALAALREGRR